MKAAPEAKSDDERALKAAVADLNGAAWTKTGDAAGQARNGERGGLGEREGVLQKASDELAAAWSKAVAEAK
jgi:hypothetical protein